MAILKCKCGCDEKIVVKDYHKWYGVPEYILGHNKHSEETKKNISKKMKGMNNHFYGKKHSEETKEKISKSLKGSKGFTGKHTAESKKKMSKARKDKYYGSKHPRWKGGETVYNHRRAWNLFGQEKCEICGMTNDEHKKRTRHRLSMHCDGHRYKNMERIFWTTCCEFGCHKDLEKLGRL